MRGLPEFISWDEWTSLPIVASDVESCSRFHRGEPCPEPASVVYLRKEDWHYGKAPGTVILAIPRCARHDPGAVFPITPGELDVLIVMRA